MGYTQARERYGALGVDTETARRCWIAHEKACVHISA